MVRPMLRPDDRSELEATPNIRPVGRMLGWVVKEYWHSVQDRNPKGSGPSFGVSGPLVGRIVGRTEAGRQASRTDRMTGRRQSVQQSEARLNRPEGRRLTVG